MQFFMDYILPVMLLVLVWAMLFQKDPKDD
jgi:hypothetical protein